MMHQMDEQPGFEGRGGALVEEAKRLMREEQEDEEPAAVENSGPKIKMSKIGGRKKKPTAGAATEKKDSAAPRKSTAPEYKVSDKSSGGFNEQDIEFMKKAI